MFLTKKEIARNRNRKNVATGFLLLYSTGYFSFYQQRYCLYNVHTVNIYLGTRQRLTKLSHVLSEHSCAGTLEQSMGVIGTEQEQGCRTGWRNRSLGIYSWAPSKFKNAVSAADTALTFNFNPICYTGCGVAQAAPSSNLGSAPQRRPSTEQTAMRILERNSMNVIN